MLIVPNKVTQNVELFVQALENSGVTRLFAVTSLVRNILAFLEMQQKKELNKYKKLSKVSNVYILQVHIQILLKVIA